MTARTSRRYQSLMERLIENSYVDPASGCWLWTGSKNNRGYPRLTMRVPGRDKPVRVYAHRLSLMVFAGRLSAAHEGHHKCGRNACINPEHLEATTKKIHRKRHQQLRRRRAAQVEHGQASSP